MLLRFFIVFGILPSLMLALVCIKQQSIKGKTKIIRYCCKGYIQVESESSLVCRPTCNVDCGKGSCDSLNTCVCEKGYDNEEHILSKTCVPFCQNGCANGKCIAPETCECNTGYYLNNSTGQCAPFCSGDCANGHCASPENCTCNEGYIKLEAEIDLGCQPFCKLKCDANRTCTAPNRCDCLEHLVDIDNECRSPEELPQSFMRRYLTELGIGLFLVFFLLLVLVCICCCRNKRTSNRVANQERNRSNPNVYAKAGTFGNELAESSPLCEVSVNG